MELHAPYLEWLGIFFVLPILLFWTVFHRILWPYRKAVMLLIPYSVIAGLLWDVFALQAHLWFWPAGCCILPRLFGIPIEELLFMMLGTICIATITIVVRALLLSHIRSVKRNRKCR